VRDFFKLPHGGRKHLINRWNALMEGLSIHPDAHFQTLDDLLTRYTEPHREYHNLAHVNTLLELLSPIPEQPVFDLELSIWFHDAVYDTTQQNNEEQSAALAEQKLSSLGIDEALIARVSQLILATKTHQATDPEMRRFLEADLSILGTPEKTYRAYAKAIRKEYGWIPDEVFQAGRARILQAFLARESIFQTEQFAGLEARARANMRGELDGLLVK
jgi:predicted metal-dependent HD superfamily phosphohydrolase